MSDFRLSGVFCYKSFDLCDSNSLNIIRNIIKHLSGSKSLIMHQSYVSPVPLGPGAYRGLSAEILPPMSSGSAVDMPGFNFSLK